MYYTMDSNGSIDKIMEDNMYTMEVNGFKAKIMEANRLVGDRLFDLPKGTPLQVYKVDDFIKKSESWIDGEGSYVVPVNPDKGLWFDWTDNDERNTAVLPSVKGCNPITGKKIDGYTLESYSNKCPEHGIEFSDDRYCEKCGYKWAPQNYVSGPDNIAWWDGFRDVDGSVRQFFFTEDMKRDVASAMLGKENTVPAFGFAFYQPKEKRMSVKINDDGTFSSLSRPKDSGVVFANYIPSLKKKSLTDKWAPVLEKDVQHKTNYFDMDVMYSSEVNYSASVDTVSVDMMSISSSVDYGYEYRSRGIEVPDQNVVEEKEVAVGAGARIKQDLVEDSYGIDSWKDEPDGVMRIYFVFKDEFNEYASHGFKGESGSMLNGLPVG